MITRGDPNRFIGACRVTRLALCSVLFQGGAEIDKFWVIKDRKFQFWDYLITEELDKWPIIDIIA